MARCTVSGKSRSSRESSGRPADTIVRKAEGGDNWPITWADDDNLYTAYGDGQGFEPKVDKKLSLGFAKIVGGPQDFTGINIRSRDRRAGGGGRCRSQGQRHALRGRRPVHAGAKRRQFPGGLVGRSRRDLALVRLEIRDKLRRPDLSELRHAITPAAIDNYVYLYSHDNDSAYSPADRMVMARVPLDRIRQRKAYEFFKALDAAGQPVWTRDIRDRGAVFVNPGRCYRSGISYNAGLKRYLWCQILPFSTDSRGPRFQGGFGIYEAPEPWGPWRTVFYTENWDVGPGETSSFPTKWMSQDGRTCHLVFSGNDCFSVRRVEFKAIQSPLP